MLNATPQEILGFLRLAWQNAGDAANTLYEELEKKHAEFIIILSGGPIASIGKNSSNQSYSFSSRALTHRDIADIYGYLLGLYDQLKSELTAKFECNADFDYAVPAGYDFDSPIYNLLKKVFNAQSSGTATVLPDISSLRLPANVPNAGEVITW